jgi:hypothetical protein
MSAQHSVRFFWSDWLGDQAVRRLTPAERGVWIDCLALMAAAAPTGYLCDDRGRSLTHEEVARVCGTTPVEVAKLLAAILEKGVASRDRTGRLYNRRMVKDASLSAKRRANGKSGGTATRLKWQELSELPRQNARQMPRQAAAPPYPIKNLTSSESGTAREQNKSAGGRASARCEGAPARPPLAEQAANGKPPAQWTRAELEAKFNSKRAANGGHHD